MSDFWHGPNNGQLVNLDHVITVDRHADGNLRITTTCPGLVLTLKSGTPDEASFLRAVGERLGSSGQLIAMLGDIRDKFDDIREAINLIEVKPCQD